MSVFNEDSRMAIQVLIKLLIIVNSIIGRSKVGVSCVLISTSLFIKDKSRNKNYLKTDLISSTILREKGVKFVNDGVVIVSFSRKIVNELSREEEE